MGKGSLPPGFRFHPTDEELVKYYLKRKVLGKKLHPPAIAEVDIYKYAPWDLPDKSWLRTGDLKWYFFCPREKKYSSGGRAKRATDIGYWKTTGNDRSVRYRNEVVGMKRTLVFHTGKPPKGDRTDWVMYEYRLTEKDLADRGVAQDAYVLSVIFKKDGPGPKNGAQYGAPFNEEDWEDDDDDEEVNVQDAILPAAMAAPLFKLPINQNMSIATTSHVQESRCTEPPIPCPSQTLPSASVLCPMGSVNDATSTEAPRVVHMEEVNGGEAVSSAGMLAPAFHVPYNQNSPTFASSSSSMPENMGYPDYIPSIEASQAEAMNSDDEIPALLAMFGDGNDEIVPDDNLDIFNGLGDISKLMELPEARDNSRSLDARNIMDPVFPDQIFRDDVLELNDLIDPLDSSMDPTHHSSDGP